MTNSQSPQTELAAALDEATFDQIERANAAVDANLNDDGSPRYESAFGYACALTAIMQTDASPSPLVDTGEALREALEDAEFALHFACNRGRADEDVDDFREILRDLQAALAAHPKPEEG